MFSAIADQLNFLTGCSKTAQQTRHDVVAYLDYESGSSDLVNLHIIEITVISNNVLRVGFHSIDLRSLLSL
jgi:hypothetical protein